jgi:cobalt/nickel transport system permease protein
MHISDGVLSKEMLIAGAALAAGGTAVGLKKIEMDSVPRVAVMTAAFFVASLIHVPIGPASVHLLFIGIVGILLGWACFPAILIGLLLQTLLFQHGGITVLGVNTVTMAFPALIVFFLCGPLVRSRRMWLSLVGAALAASLAILLSALCTAFALIFTGEEFTTIAKLILIGHLPVMGIEALIAVFVVSLFKKVKPEILRPPYTMMKWREKTIVSTQ